MKHKKIVEATQYINSKLGTVEASLGILTGTGMKGIADIGKTLHKISYQDIPHFPKTTVESHAGELSLVEINGRQVIIFSGRFHYYEGYKSWEICFPIYIMKMLGVEQLLMTNASGGLNESYRAGDIVIVSDHINFMGRNPLTGENDDRLGIRFPDMSDAYNQKMRNTFRQIMGDDYKEGVYASMVGPSLETPAEYKFLHTIGADLVGMSTVPEVIAAAHAGIKTAVLSVVSNMCYPIVASNETTIEDVINVVQNSNPKVVELIEVYCKS